MDKDISLNFLFYPDPDEPKRLVGHCLEFSLVASGRDMETCARQLIALVKAHYAHCKKKDRMDQLFFPAPGKYWAMLGQARHVRLPRIKLPKLFQASGKIFQAA